jgi:hypothetical protein
MSKDSSIPKEGGFLENWRTALFKLIQSGYSVVVDGDKIRVRKYTSSPKDDMEPFISYLKANKNELLNSTGFLIDATISEVERVWIPEALEWMKYNDPASWEKMLQLENQINETAKANDTEALKGALTEYRVLMVGMVEKCKKALTDDKPRQMELKVLSSSEGSDD